MNMEVNKILQGDIKEISKQLPSNFVNTIVTSPPYWGLRDYGTAIWIDGNSDCDHRPKRKNGTGTQTITGGITGNHMHEGFKGDSCPKCGAKRIDNQIGLEATPGEHVTVLVNLFQELRRVLRDDGTLWLNYGDCYATSPNGRSAADTKAAGKDDRTFRDKPFSTIAGGLKPKDLVGMPWRIALALQADGWYLRSDIIWSKPNCMPSSVRDRPTLAHEYIFLLSKSPKYYYDQDAIKEPKATSSLSDSRTNADGQRRNRDFPGQASNGGTNLGGGSDYANKRTVWTVNTHPYSEAHFATFPPQLIRPCILAGCPPGGVVFDPFFGSGTVGQVAVETGRYWLGVDLKTEYIELATNRIAKAQPALFIFGSEDNKRDEPKQAALWGE